MKILILGGGAQGKAALYDLCQNKEVEAITMVEYDLKQVKEFTEKLGDSRIRLLSEDANDKEKIKSLMSEHDITIDLLPTEFRKQIAGLAIKTKKPLVNTSFKSNIKDYAEDAEEEEVLIMPEAGLDPGIDLILAGKAVKNLETVEAIESSCGGIPAPEYCNNPLNYKVSWNFEGVLNAYKRPASLVIDGKKVPINGEDIFNHGKEIDILGIGKLERYPNGFATTYAQQLGIRKEVSNVGRYTLRWPGHCAFWKKMSELGMLDDESESGISPKKMLAQTLGPKLQYKDHEEDMIILRNEITGFKDGKKKKIIQQLVDKRDMNTGLMAMNRTVGFTASIVAQMILQGKITGYGILNPAQHIPHQEFIEELQKRGIKINEWEEDVHC